MTPTWHCPVPGCTSPPVRGSVAFTERVVDDYARHHGGALPDRGQLLTAVAATVTSLLTHHLATDHDLADVDTWLHPIRPQAPAHRAATSREAPRCRIPRPVPHGAAAPPAWP